VRRIFRYPSINIFRNHLKCIFIKCKFIYDVVIYYVDTFQGIRVNAKLLQIRRIFLIRKVSAILKLLRDHEALRWQDACVTD